MKRIYSLYKIRKPAAAIGIFDGVHCGHQKILKKLVQEAFRLKAKTLAITFYPHPREVLNPGIKVPLLTSLRHRSNLIEKMGVDFFLVIKFTRSISKMKADDFIKKILMDRLDIRTLVIGENFLFGHRKKGNFKLLMKAGKKFGFRIFGVKPVKMKGAFISSTRIRKKIEKGDLKNASRMLGRPVTVLGTVVSGRRIGRKLGFPTANINPHHEAIPPSGVYAVGVRIHKKIYSGLINIGTAPTFGNDRDQTLELHILNFKKDIYKKDVEIIFKRKIRDEKKFTSIGALRIQIQKDILRAR